MQNQVPCRWRGCMTRTCLWTGTLVDDCNDLKIHTQIKNDSKLIDEGGNAETESNCKANTYILRRKLTWRMRSQYPSHCLHLYANVQLNSSRKLRGVARKHNMSMVGGTKAPPSTANRPFSLRPSPVVGTSVGRRSESSSSSDVDAEMATACIWERSENTWDY
jgi:hypothetical protein